MLGRGIHFIGRFVSNKISNSMKCPIAKQNYYFSQQGITMMNGSSNMANHLVILNLREMLEKSNLDLQNETQRNPNSALSLVSQGRAVINHHIGMISFFNVLTFRYADCINKIKAKILYL